MSTKKINAQLMLEGSNCIKGHCSYQKQSLCGRATMVSKMPRHNKDTTKAQISHIKMKYLTFSV